MIMMTARLRSSVSSLTDVLPDACQKGTRLNHSDSSATVQDYDNHQANELRIPRKPVGGTKVYKELAQDEQMTARKMATPTSEIDPNLEKRPGLLSLWWLEVASCLLFITAFIALVTTLRICNGSPLPDLPFKISINTLVAFYSVILKGAAALVLANGISQCKWSWFQTPERLADLVVYDDASRGPWGAFTLLWHLRLRPIVTSIGAFTTVLLIVIEPFTQQILQFRGCPSSSSGKQATIARTNLYDDIGVHIGAGLRRLPSGFLASIGSGIFGNLSQPSFHCPTGNCMFSEKYSTLGYCSQCVDVSDQVTGYQDMSKSVPYFYTPPSQGLNITSGITAGAMSYDDEDGRHFGPELARRWSMAASLYTTGSVFAPVDALRQNIHGQCRRWSID